MREPTRGLPCPGETHSNTAPKPGRAAPLSLRWGDLASATHREVRPSLDGRVNRSITYSLHLLSTYGVPGPGPAPPIPNLSAGLLLSTGFRFALHPAGPSSWPSWGLALLSGWEARGLGIRRECLQGGLCLPLPSSHSHSTLRHPHSQLACGHPEHHAGSQGKGLSAGSPVLCPWGSLSLPLGLNFPFCQMGGDMAG